MQVAITPIAITVPPAAPTTTVPVFAILVVSLTATCTQVSGEAYYYASFVDSQLDDPSNTPATTPTPPYFPTSTYRPPFRFSVFLLQRTHSTDLHYLHPSSHCLTCPNYNDNDNGNDNDNDNDDNDNAHPAMAIFPTFRQLVDNSSVYV